MNEENQITKLCGICGYKGDINEYHRCFNACRKCAPVKSAKHYQTIKDKYCENKIITTKKF